MNIKYEDITLRAIEESDLDLLYEMINDPEIERMTCGGDLPVSKAEQRRWFENLNKNDVRLIIDTEECGAIGVVMLTNIDRKNSVAAFHSKIASSKDIRGKGYGTKATKALIQYAFNQMNIHCIYSKIIEYNFASQRVKEKCGFIKEGVLRDRVFKDGKYHNVVIWSITREDFDNAGF